MSLMQWLRTGQHWGKCNLASPCCMLLSGFEGKSCCSGQLTRVPLWYFVTLTLKSNESEISSGYHSLGSKMYHLLGLWISDFFNTIMRAAELHSFSPVLSLKRNGCLENVLYWRTKKRGCCCCYVVLDMIFPVIMLVCSDEFFMF